MKTLNNYINEALIKKDTKIDKYQYHPKDFNELKSLLKQLLEERGKDADLNDIDVSNITTFYGGAYDLGLFNHLDPHNIDISEWNVSNVENMRYMFYGCQNFNCDLSKLDVGQVKDMGFMFYGCQKFNSDLSGWDVSDVKNMNYMFTNCYNFNSDLSRWDVSNVKSMISIFWRCASLKQTPRWYK